MKVLIGPNPMGVESFISELKEKYTDIDFVHCTTHEDILIEIADADIYLGWLNRETFLAAKNLKWIQSPSSGIDSYMTIPEVAKGDVILTSASGTHGACLAESALAMVLAFTRGIRDCILHQQKHEWTPGDIRSKLVELTGSTMGIIGFGTVGRALAKRAQIFDMRIIAVDLRPGDKPEYVSELWEMDHLPELLRQSDYVVVTVPRTPQTLDMIGSAQLAMMKPGAILIGISRGGIINQEALAEALSQKSLAAAALDVFFPEPLPVDSKLWDMDNLLITPHIAGGTQFESRHIISIFCENLERLVQGRMPLRNQVDKHFGF